MGPVGAEPQWGGVVGWGFGPHPPHPARRNAPFSPQSRQFGPNPKAPRLRGGSLGPEWVKAHPSPVALHQHCRKRCSKERLSSVWRRTTWPPAGTPYKGLSFSKAPAEEWGCCSWSLSHMGSDPSP